jgi:hypothetical protein
MLSSGEIKEGLYRSSAVDHLVLAHQARSLEWRFKRDEISRVFRVRPGVRNTSKGTFDGAKKGGEIGRGIDRAAGGSDQDYLPGIAMAAGVGAAVGAIKGSDRVSSRRVLVYSQ